MCNCKEILINEYEKAQKTSHIEQHCGCLGFAIHMVSCGDVEHEGDGHCDWSRPFHPIK